jgi:aspartyl/glutamyl-tRNA(Asn/Gln) amidotransferase C subunit
MKIDLDRLASLSGLSLSDAEKESFSADIGEMLSFADKIKSSTPLSDRPAPFFVHSEVNALRKDEYKAGLSSDALLRASADRKNGFIAVPEVLSDKGADK